MGNARMTFIVKRREYAFGTCGITATGLSSDTRLPLCAVCCSNVSRTPPSLGGGGGGGKKNRMISFLPPSALSICNALDFVKLPFAPF